MHACHESRRTGADTANPLYTRIECQTQDECGMSLRRMVYWVNWDADTIFLVDKATASTFMQQRGYYGSHAINENCIHFALPMTSWPEIDRAWNTRHHLPSMNTLTLAVPIPDSAPTPTTGSSIRLVGLTPYSVPRRVLGVLTTDPACAVRARLWCFKEQLPMLERATVMSVRHQDPRVLSGEEKKQEYKRREMVRGRKTQVERDLEYATRFVSLVPLAFRSDSNRCWYRLALDLELEGRARRRAERHREAKVKLTEEAPPISE